MLTNVLFPEITFNLDKILNGFSIIIISIFILLYSELLNSEIKNTYELNFGMNSWHSVRQNSIIVGICSGITAGIGSYIWNDGHYFYYLVNISTLLGYISMQAIMTDYSLHKVDRYLLRIAYIDTFLITTYSLLSQYKDLEALKMYATPVVVTYIALIILFFFSSIGPSDIRAMFVFLPYIVSINVDIAGISFIVVGLAIAIIMQVKKVKSKNKAQPIPILPYLTIPYIVLIPFIPLIIDINRAVYL